MEGMRDDTDSTVLFTERLSPAWWIWLVAAGFSAAWILVFQPVSAVIGVIVALIVFGALAVVLTTTTPAVSVTRRRVRAGRASIEPWLLASPEALRGEDARRARGVEFNALSYQCIRGWIQPMVRVEVADPEDSTPYWLISTRRPEELAEALRKAGAPSRPDAERPKGEQAAASPERS